ncbi:hypothetical protein CMV30_10290 [Nibricoccus aquaticus]|uniref:4-O-methyl-glucuronoyl methylesterase-like domain-containing protein n=1 Tax=Nibricoccus aquaticus TaxID=2576891 RepID=A0A290QIZ1_9BACT|nr:alpha/beta hydrolase family protein [Nibricoccus aquaticus]ATC64311.1 hypothetical protein CMV30_10290 [Nibricoccus aquaticus]
MRRSHRIPARCLPTILSILLILSSLRSPSLHAQPTAPDPTMIAGEPDPREIPVPSIKTNLAPLPGPDALPLQTALPDPLLKTDGTRITSSDAWQKHRTEIRRTLEYYAVGAIPPAPGNVKGRVISSRPVLDGFASYRLVHLTFGPGEKLSLNIGIFTPSAPADTSFPVVIFPGGTPPGASPLPALSRPPGQGKGVNALLPVEPSKPALAPTSATNTSVNTAAASSFSGGNPVAPKSSENADLEAFAKRIRPILARGYAYITFNNNDCAEDTTLRLPDGSWAFRTTRFYPAYPEYDWGILGGWAWGVSRIVDYVETDSALNASKVIVSGISRTGKSAMVAAAFDDRIALGAPVVTGGGGVGAYRFSGEGRGGKEGLDLMMKKYPNWFSPHLHPFRGQTDKLPFDQHWFLALIAPRPFIALEGTTDGVSVMNAVKQSTLAAQPVYALFNATDKLGINYAEHGHTITADDWTAMLDFADKHLLGKPVTRRFDQFPSE